MRKVDERGKYFTDRLNKHSVEVLIATPQGHIRGHVHVLTGQRVKDLLNSDTEQFLAVTDATLNEHDSPITQNLGFIALNKRHIISVIPIDEELPTEPEDEYRPY